MRKKCKRKVREVQTDPLGFVLQQITPIASYKTYLPDLKLQNNSAFHELTRGTAGKDHIDVLISMHNIMEAFRLMIQAKKIELMVIMDDSTLIRSKAALLDLGVRGRDIGRFVCKAPELQAITDLMLMHDELMDLVTVGDFEKAITYTRSESSSKRATSINNYLRSEGATVEIVQ